MIIHLISKNVLGLPDEETEGILQQKIDELIYENKNLSREFQILKLSIEDMDETFEEKLEAIGEEVHDLKMKGNLTLVDLQLDFSTHKNMALRKKYLI